MSTLGNPLAGQQQTKATPSQVWQSRLWYWQRISAMVLAICVVVHLGVMIYAVRGGLSAGEILGRTQGSVLFGGLYTLFVLSCAIHVPIGLLNVMREWLNWQGRGAALVAGLFGVLITLLGLRAVYGVVLA